MVSCELSSNWLKFSVRTSSLGESIQSARVQVV
jgi:hypothetical protein